MAWGLIPAHAGKTDPHRAYRPHDEAHPRSRGENLAQLSPAVASQGSSPLTRGKHVGLLRRIGPRRLIPAHAGKTETRSCSRLPRWAHPRSRGENFFGSARLKRTSGSSPLTRGKLGVSISDVGDGGLIPAHAGKTFRRCRRASPPRAHPRSRGENATRDYASACQLGSSPLTRGKPAPCMGQARHGGLIPAHAGKTPGFEPFPRS